MGVLLTETVYCSRLYGMHICFFSPIFIFCCYYLLTENEDKQLWNPGHLVSKDVEEYLSKSQEAIQTGGVGSLPMGAHVRDDEQVWL